MTTVHFELGRKKPSQYIHTNLAKLPTSIQDLR